MSWIEMAALVAACAVVGFALFAMAEALTEKFG